MQFRLEKCATATLKRGNLINNINVMFDEETMTRELDQKQASIYLGNNELDRVQPT